MKNIAILLVVILLCPAFAFAVEQQKPVAADETVAIAEDATTGDVVGEAVETDEFSAPETAKDIKAEAKEEVKEVNAEAKEDVQDIKAEEKEVLKEAKM